MGSHVPSIYKYYLSILFELNSLGVWQLSILLFQEIDRAFEIQIIATFGPTTIEIEIEITTN